MTPDEATTVRERVDAELSAADDELRKQQQKLARLRGQYRQHQIFDRRAAQEGLEAHVEAMKLLMERRDATNVTVEGARVALEGTNANLAKAVWLTRRRRTLKRAVKPQRDALAAKLRELEAIDEDMQARRAALEAATRELAAYDAFDAASAPRRIAKLEAAVEVQRQVTAEVRGRHERLHARIDPLLEERADHLKEIARLQSELGTQQRKQSRIEQQMRDAEEFKRELDAASSPYERRMIHERCDAALGDGSPGAVRHRLRSELRDATRSAERINPRLAKARRDLAKLDDRIGEVTQRQTRVITRLVIDGNNLCYDNTTPQGNPFIGLAALKQTTQALMGRYEIVVVFDASILPLLHKKSAEELKHRLPECTVHIVPTRTKADETVLRLANDDPNTYVLSNDRYADYPDMSAVHEGRLIRHEVVDRRVIVNELDVDRPYLAIRSTA